MAVTSFLACCLIAVGQVTPIASGNNSGQWMNITILITRPDPEASRFAAQLRVEFGTSVSLLSAPLMTIVYGGSLPDLTGQEILIFTSRQGVTGFCRLSARRDFSCYAVGDATAAAARAAGLAVVSAGGDADTLLSRIAEDGKPGPFLHLRGAHVAADVAGALRAMDCTADEVVVYEQVEVEMGRAAQDRLAESGPVIVPMMSPRSARLFFEQAQAIKAPLLVAAISRKVAQMVPEGATFALQIAETPDVAGLIKALHDLVTEAKRLERYNTPQ